MQGLGAVEEVVPEMVLTGILYYGWGRQDGGKGSETSV
jgi:hypothetical protein